jgi:hypothetical protein
MSIFCSIADGKLLPVFIIMNSRDTVTCKKRSKKSKSNDVILKRGSGRQLVRIGMKAVTENI